MTDDKISIQLNQPNPLLISQVEYHLTNYLTSGVLGDLYHIKDKNLVVKVPRTDANRLFQFGQESRLLAYLSQKTNYTPPIAVSTDPNQPSIVMEFYPDDALYHEKLVKLLFAKNYPDAEIMTLKVMIAFCEVMIQLHLYVDKGNQDKKYTCTDRKVSDFYYFNDEKIIIVDWNVLSEPTPDFYNSEVQVLATLIHEAYFGAKGKFPYAPFYDRRWELSKDDSGAISVGLRFILARMVNQPTTYYATTDGSDYFIRLKAHLEAWKNAWAENWTLDTVKTKLEVDDTRFADAIYQDLVWRKNPQTITPDKRAEILKIADDLGASESEKLRKNIINALNFTVREARTFLGANPPTSENDKLLPVHWGRWKLLLDVFNEDNLNQLDSRTKSEIRALISNIGEKLHTDEPLLAEEIKSIRQSYERLRQLYADTDENLADIQYEIELHDKVFMFNQIANFDTRADLLRNIIRTGDNNHYLTEPFFHHLFDTYLLQRLTTANSLDDLRREYALIILTQEVKHWGKWVENWLASLKQVFVLIDAYDQDTNYTSVDKIPDRLQSTATCLAQLNAGWYDVIVPVLQKRAKAEIEQFMRRVKITLPPNRVVFGELRTIYPLVMSMKKMLDVFWDDPVQKQFELIFNRPELGALIDQYLACKDNNEQYIAYHKELFSAMGDDEKFEIIGKIEAFMAQYAPQLDVDFIYFEPDLTEVKAG